MQKPEFLFVVVNYFSEEEVLHFFQHEVLDQQSSNWFLCLVNNGSKDSDTIEKIKKLGVHIIQPNSNAGYLGAAGIALEYFKQAFDNFPSLLVLSNSDMHYTDKKMLSSWANDYSQSHHIGLIGCRITSTLTGKAQNPMYRERLSKNHLQRLASIFSYKFSYNLYQTAALIKGKILSGFKNATSSNIETVYAIHGSCMLMHRSLLEIHDVFRDAPFLFGEEVYLAEICRRENLQVVFDPTFEILHQEHQTTGIYKSAIQQKRLATALKLILNKFYS